MNRRVIEIGLRHRNGCLLLLLLRRCLGYLRLRCANCGMVRIRVGLRQIQLLLADDSLLGQPQAPLVIGVGLDGGRFGFLQASLGGNQISFGVGIIRLGLQYRALE